MEFLVEVSLMRKLQKFADLYWEKISKNWLLICRVQLDYPAHWDQKDKLDSLDLKVCFDRK